VSSITEPDADHSIRPICADVLYSLSHAEKFIARQTTGWMDIGQKALEHSPCRWILWTSEREYLFFCGTDKPRNAGRKNLKIKQLRWVQHQTIGLAFSGVDTVTNLILLYCPIILNFYFFDNFITSVEDGGENI
jgi:hypothetical protein